MLFVSRYRVAGHSMEPAFSEGDYVLVLRHAIGRLKRGDVVVIEKAHRKMLKRIAALPGERIRGDLLAEGEYWVVSDNHGSGSENFGPVTNKEILGKVALHIRK